MSLSKQHLERVRIIGGEVLALALAVEEEMKLWPHRDYDEGTGTWTDDSRPTNPHPGYTKASAALKRRSLDLTRALADLRSTR